MSAQMVTRRRLLGRATIGVAAALGIGWAVPAVTFVLSPARKGSRVAEWRTLSSVEKIRPGTPSLFKARVTRTTGWVTTEDEVAVYVHTEDGREFLGLSNICTHLGCRVRWVAAQQQYFCPCHVGVFAKDGSVVSGPPPRPLDKYPIRVEDGQIQVQLDV